MERPPAPRLFIPALFAAAVRAIYDGPVEGFLRVDPRPLRADPKLVTLNPALARAVPDRVTASSSPLATVPAEVIRRRSEVLERLGVPQVDALERPPCAGSMVPWDRRPSIREGCPKQGQITIAILGVPRPGGAYLPSSVDERAEGLRQGYWTVRVIEKLLGPARYHQHDLGLRVREECERHGLEIGQARGSGSD